MSQNVTWRQRRYIRALLTGTGKKQDAAKAAGVTRQTTWRWEQQDAFQQALRDATADAITGLSTELVRLSRKAAETLEWAMDGAERDGTRVRAADIVLSRLLSIRELHDIEMRLTTLEERL